jgi:GTP:adenosylcobinamide-phosphate guanylyltransferase
MDAIITAGGIPQPDDPLYAYTRGEAKAMVDVAGQPMIQWVLDALGRARGVDNIIITGLPARSELRVRKPVHYLSNQGKMLDNILAGVRKSQELSPRGRYVLIVSSDIPAVKADMVDWLIQTCLQTQDDLYYGVCPRAVMERRYPGSKRTYTHLKDMDVCGADMNVVHVRMASEHVDVWDALITRRKSPFAQAAVMGLGLSFQYATGQLTLDDAVERVARRIGVRGRAIVWSHAEPCMDVDKPNQLEIMRADLGRAARKASPKKKAAVKKKTHARAAKRGARTTRKK